MSSTRYACRDCGDPIPNGMAVIRSESLKEVIRCAHCYGVKYLGYEPRAGGKYKIFSRAGG